VSEVVVAEVESPEQLVIAAERVRELGYARFEAFSPFPIAELDRAMPIRRTRLPWFVLAAGLSGAVGALFILWWTNAYDYPIDVGGRPLFSLPADIPIVFESTVLAASFVAFVGVLFGARLPRLHDPLFDLPGFERTRVDRYWLVLEDADFFDEDIRRAGDSPRRSTLLRSVQEDALAKLRAELESIGATVTLHRLGGAA
jgi:hypothetical protein